MYLQEENPVRSWGKGLEGEDEEMHKDEKMRRKSLSSAGQPAKAKDR